MLTPPNHRLYLALTRTPTHVGCGQGLGEIDLPIQRNSWGLPILPGSSIKGVLRQSAAEAWRCTPGQIAALFGPDRADAGDHAGMLAPQDARLLAMPVASLCGGWAWVTCPGMLMRYRRDAAAAGYPGLPALPAAVIEAQSASVASLGSPLLMRTDGHIALLHESVLQVQADDCIGVWGQHLAAMAFPQDDATWRQDFAQRLIVVNDDLFHHFTQVATEVRARVALDENRVANDRALWREECVPADSLFWGLVSAFPIVAKPRTREASSVAPAALSVAEALALMRSACLQIGGKASVGYGWLDFLPQPAAAGAAQ